MTTSFLTTKLYLPPPCPGLVKRPRLIEQLDEGLRLGRKLTPVSAPAGFETTLIGEWVCGGERGRLDLVGRGRQRPGVLTGHLGARLCVTIEVKPSYACC
jgi:hypothetical protein